MRYARHAFLFLVVACSGTEQPIGRISVVAQALTSPAQITRVTITVTPANVTGDLTVDPADPTRFTGSLVVPVGLQTVRADAFNGGQPVGTGNAIVTVSNNAHVLAQITILDSTGPVPGPDHSPVVTSLVTPTAAQVGDQVTVNAAAMDADGDAMTFAWTASPSGCGSFANPATTSTVFTATVIGTCTVTFTVTANGKSDSKSAPIQISAATGSIDVTVTYVPQPLISQIAFSTGVTQVASVLRTAQDATIRTPFHKGTAYTIALTFDAWPSGAIALSDSCSGTIVQPTFPAGGTSASGTWTPTLSSGACILTATLQRTTPSQPTLTDTFFVVVLPAP
jgi:hypothetical protein